MKAYELLSNPLNWNKGNYASDQFGHPVLTNSSLAVKFCIIGAVYKCYNDDENMEAVYRKLVEACEGNPTGWNDRPDRTHSQVIALLKDLDI